MSILLVGLTACEGMKMISPIVVSPDGKAVAGAEINVLNGVGDSTTTDSAGRFIIRTGFTSMSFGGPKFKFEVKKDGYETQVIKAKYPADTIRLIAK